MPGVAQASDKLVYRLVDPIDGADDFRSEDIFLVDENHGRVSSLGRKVVPQPVVVDPEKFYLCLSRD